MATVINLPGAASPPVQQPGRRGRHPRTVASLERHHRDKLLAQHQPTPLRTASQLDQQSLSPSDLATPEEIRSELRQLMKAATELAYRLARLESKFRGTV